MGRIGWVEGQCPRCGQILRRKYPADLAVCDCYKYCPLCGAEMTPFTSDFAPNTYRGEESYGVKGQGVESSEWTFETLYYCPNHSPPYYSKLKPVEVILR